MTDLPSNNEISQYPVSIWEGILIGLGAIALTALGMVGLGVKVLNNAFDPVRAEAIAKSLMEYKIPGGSQGIFGINIGGAKLAWVRSTTNPPNVVLFVGKTPVVKESDQEAQHELEQDFENPPSDEAKQEFVARSSHTESRLFCGRAVPITVETGQQMMGDLAGPAPAVRYIINTTENSFERLVILTASGDQPEKKADTILRSFKCN